MKCWPWRWQSTPPSPPKRPTHPSIGAAANEMRAALVVPSSPPPRLPRHAPIASASPRSKTTSRPLTEGSKLPVLMPPARTMLTSRMFSKSTIVAKPPRPRMLVFRPRRSRHSAAGVERTSRPGIHEQTIDSRVVQIAKSASERAARMQRTSRSESHEPRSLNSCRA